MTSDTDKEIASIQAQIDKYANYNKELDSTIEKISDRALHAKSYFQSSIISKKHEILKLLLSNSEVNGKKLTFSIIKPFDKLLFSKGCKIWYAELSTYRANHYDELISLRPKIDSFYEKIGAIVVA